MDEYNKVYWHEAFFEALQLEFHQYADVLTFENEHPLSKEALIMDVLIIKKQRGVQIEKNIGRIFRAHNIFEFKSEKDSFSVWDYNKIMGYAFLYSAFEKIPLSDITLNVALTMHPREVIKYLKNERLLNVQNAGEGIYCIEGDIVPVQILESKRLSPEDNLFIRNLRSNLSAEDLSHTLQAFEVKNVLDKRNVYLNRLFKANLNTLREVLDMKEDSWDFMKPIIEEWLGKGRFNEIISEEINATANATAKTIAKHLLNYGDPIEKIVAVTKLPAETIRELELA